MAKDFPGLAIKQRHLATGVGGNHPFPEAIQGGLQQGALLATLLLLALHLLDHRIERTSELTQFVVAVSRGPQTEILGFANALRDIGQISQRPQ